MQLSNEQLEWIVREVVRRLTAGAAAPDAGDALRVQDRVVTTATVKGRLNGVRRLVVSKGAIVTPSVRDDLRERQITLVRE